MQSAEGKLPLGAQVWDAIPYIGGGLTLVAFVVAALVQAYGLKLRSARENLSKVPERDRLEAMQIAEQYFRIDTDGFSQAKRMEIIRQQLQLKEQRQRQTTIVILVVAALLAAVTIIALLKEEPGIAAGSAVREYTVCNVDLDNSHKCPPNDFLERIGHSASHEDIVQIAEARCAQKGLRPAIPAGYMKSDTSGGKWGVNVIVIRCMT